MCEACEDDLQEARFYDRIAAICFGLFLVIVGIFLKWGWDWLSYLFIRG